MTHPHETWQDEPQSERRSILGSLRAAEDEEEQPTDDQERKDEDYLDTSRGVWGPTE